MAAKIIHSPATFLGPKKGSGHGVDGHPRGQEATIRGWGKGCGNGSAEKSRNRSLKAGLTGQIFPLKNFQAPPFSLKS
jgi:hypothetical protein